MIPLFKSHFSIGKSILTLNPPSSNQQSKSDSVFDIAADLQLDTVVLVEDSFMGFLQGQKVCKELGHNFIFGLRISIIPEDFDENLKKVPTHKVVVFSKNAEGCKILFKIYSQVKSSQHDAITLGQLQSLWSSKNLDLAIPFYDSFLFCNLFLFNQFVLDLTVFNPKFFIENNGLPFDDILSEHTRSYCDKMSFESVDSKSIYYKNRSDFDAFITYKLICSRNSFASNKSSLEKPNFDHMGSREFCGESFQELQLCLQ